MSDDEFYIGYESAMPRGIARRVRPIVVGLIAVLIAAASVATWAQRPLPAATFAYGRPQTFTGWLTLEPTPALEVIDAGRTTRYWLVGRGKFGAAAVLSAHRDGWVSLEATEIVREHWRMLEIVPATVRRLPSNAPPPPQAPVVRTAFHGRGEIVDAKCYLGVMNPGEGAAHRDCATRCLSGGVPLMFAYRDARGESHLALLLSTDGGIPDTQWKRRAGLSTQIDGELLVRGDEEAILVEAR
jgi:hypothetical protein